MFLKRYLTSAVNYIPMHHQTVLGNEIMRRETSMTKGGYTPWLVNREEQRVSDKQAVIW